MAGRLILLKLFYQRSGSRIDLVGQEDLSKVVELAGFDASALFERTQTASKRWFGHKYSESSRFGCFWDTIYVHWREVTGSV